MNKLISKIFQFPEYSSKKNPSKIDTNASSLNLISISVLLNTPGRCEKYDKRFAGLSSESYL